MEKVERLGIGPQYVLGLRQYKPDAPAREYGHDPSLVRRAICVSRIQTSDALGREQPDLCERRPTRRCRADQRL